jgi:hypothetical protein
MIKHNNAGVYDISRVFVHHPTADVLARRHDRRTVSAPRIESQGKDLVSRTMSVERVSVCVFVHGCLGIRCGVISKPNVSVFPGPRIERIAA